MCSQSGDLREVARHMGASVLDHACKEPQDCGGDAYKSAVPIGAQRIGYRYSCDNLELLVDL